jgi:hypothetical protein
MHQKIVTFYHIDYYEEDDGKMTVKDAGVKEWLND